MKVKNILIAIIFSVTAIVTAFAADPTPLAMLKKISNQELSELDNHVGKLKNNNKLVNGIVNRTVVPHFDLDHMTMKVVGPYWK